MKAEFTEEEAIEKVLNMIYWPETLDTRMSYVVTHDDNDGDKSQQLNVCISCDGDLWINTAGLREPSLRYKMPCGGGGQFPKIRNALLVLAEAVRQETESKENQR